MLRLFSFLSNSYPRVARKAGSSLARGNGSCHADHPRQCSGNDSVLITKEWNRPQMKSMCFLAICPPCESPIFTYHILSPCLPCNTHKKTESLSARGLRCRLAKILIGFPQEFLFTGWLVEGCRVSSPPSIPKALSVYNWYEINKCSRNLTTPGKVAISKLAIGSWRLSSFHRSLGVSSFFLQASVDCPCGWRWSHADEGWVPINLEGSYGSNKTWDEARSKELGGSLNFSTK